MLGLTLLGVRLSSTCSEVIVWFLQTTPAYVAHDPIFVPWQRIQPERQRWFSDPIQCGWITSTGMDGFCLG